MNYRHPLLRACFLPVLLFTVAVTIGFLPHRSIIAAPEQKARVISVGDGDTVTLLINNRKERSRLIGIDTPESKSNVRAGKQAVREHLDSETIVRLGARAATFTRTILPRGTEVGVEYDQDRRDHYGRLLVYLWLPDGSMANERIVREGYAYILTIPPNVKYRDRFAAAFQESREKKRGLWGNEGK